MPLASSLQSATGAAHALSAIPPLSLSAVLPVGVTPGPPLLAAIAGVAFVAGAMNSIAGGGTLLTFPALVALGVTPLVANATSTVALWPGAAASMWGYRSDLRGARRWAAGFAMPSLAGGTLGALLLLRTPARWFDAIVPWLVLSATAVFLVQRPLLRFVRRRAGHPRRGTGDGASGAAAGDDGAAADVELTCSHPRPSLLVAQFLVGIYGGYFGAGVGILMLAALGLMGLTNIHRMNGLKNWGGLCMNAMAAITFASSRLVSWPVAGAMALGAIAGGYGGSRMAQRVPKEAVRRAIAAIGIGSGVWLLVR